MVSLAAAQILGVDRMRELAERAEAAEQWWSATIRWSHVGTALEGAILKGPVYRHAIQLLENVESDGGSDIVGLAQYAKHKFELTLIQTVIKLFDVDDIARYRDRLTELCTVQAAKDDPIMSSDLVLSMTVFPFLQHGEMMNFLNGVLRYHSYLAQAAAEHVGTTLGNQCLQRGISFSALGFDMISTSTLTTVEDVYGERGCKMYSGLARFALEDHFARCLFPGALCTMDSAIKPRPLSYAGQEARCTVLVFKWRLQSNSASKMLLRVTMVLGLQPTHGCNPIACLSGRPLLLPASS
jgi:hypothetical protein